MGGRCNLHRLSLRSRVDYRHDCGMSVVRPANSSLLAEAVDGRSVAVRCARRAAPDARGQAEPGPRPRTHDRARLSTREFDILALLVEGLEYDDIARSLHLAPDTVKAHVSKVLQKLGARSRTHAAALALRGGLID